MNYQNKLKIIDYPSIIASMVLCFHFINGVIGVGGVSVLNILIIIILTILALKEKRFSFNKYILFSIIMIIFDFIISFIRVSDITYTVRYLSYFITFSIVAMLSGSEKINIPKVIKNNIYIGIVGLLVYFIRGFGEYNSSITMGISYSLLPIFFSAIISIINYRQERLVSIICTFLIFYFYILVAPRGVWLVLGFYLFFLIMFRICQTKKYITRMIIKISILSISTFLIFLISENLYEIIYWLNSMLISKFDLSINALNKILFYLYKGDLVNGRFELWDLAKLYILESPILGHGIGYFEVVNLGAHPHNIILQLMCEKGIFFGGIIALVIYGKAICILLTTDKIIQNDQYDYIAMVILCGFVMLFYSSSYWLWVPFWYGLSYIFIGHNCYIYSDIRKYEIENR